MLGAALVFLLASIGIGRLLFAPGTQERYGSALDAGFVACVVAFVTCSVLAITQWARVAVQGPPPPRRRSSIARWFADWRDVFLTGVSALREDLTRGRDRMPD